MFYVDCWQVDSQDWIFVTASRVKGGSYWASVRCHLTVASRSFTANYTVHVQGTVAAWDWSCNLLRCVMCPKRLGEGASGTFFFFLSRTVFTVKRNILTTRGKSDSLKNVLQLRGCALKKNGSLQQEEMGTMLQFTARTIFYFLVA